jgi:hypothetical protein
VLVSPLGSLGTRRPSFQPFQAQGNETRRATNGVHSCINRRWLVDNQMEDWVFGEARRAQEDDCRTHVTSFTGFQGSSSCICASGGLHIKAECG